MSDITGAVFVPLNSTHVYDYREGQNAVAVNVVELNEDVECES